jgi:hypothetical protein
MFAYKLTYATFAGSYKPNQEFILSSYLPDFTMKNLAELFEYVSAFYIRVPEMDIRIDAATIYLGSSKGISVTLHDFEIAGYKVKKAEVEILSGSARITGKLDRKVIEFGDVKLHDPELDIFMVSHYLASRARRTDTVIRGKVELENHPLTFPAAAYLYVSPGSKDTEWTVMATLTDSSSPTLPLSKIAPQVAGSSLDLALKEVVFVAASTDKPNTGLMILSQYKPFRRGKSLSLLRLRHSLRIKNRCTNLCCHR